MTQRANDAGEWLKEGCRHRVAPEAVAILPVNAETMLTAVACDAKRIAVITNAMWLLSFDPSTIAVEGTG